jgi:hypothetical protein
MTSRAAVATATVLALGFSLGCSSGSVAGAPGDDGDATDKQVESIVVELHPDRRAFVELATPSVVHVDGLGETSIAWDLALQGRDIFTNGGISGPGDSSAFGPLSAPTFLSDTAPDVPLLLKDRAGGALLDWYDYGGNTHQLFSRYHVYALRDGERLYKLQVLGYYGERRGAPVAALYHVRYAEVTPDGVAELHELSMIDATAGGSEDSDDEPSACLELDRERITPLTPAEARRSMDWQLCFRREAIAVNGGLSGPRGVSAVDLQADETAGETEAEIQARSAESEQERFAELDYAALDDSALVYREDGVVTAFGARWLVPGSSPLELSDSSWLVVGADGASKYLLRLSELSGDPGREPAALRLEAKSVR